MPYDTSAFRQSNSQMVPGYAGNTLKEYSELLADKQQKYDTGLALFDELGNAVHGVVGNSKDNPQLQKLYGKYNGMLSEYAAKGNFEDLVPTVTRAARQFASEYQPFAAAYQQRGTYLTELKKKLDEGKIDQNQYQMAAEASDNSYTGLQQDPLTGRWTGSYNGMGVVEKPDMNKAVDLAMKDHVPVNAKFVGFAKNGDYIYANEQETKTFSADRVRGVVQSYLANDKDFQNYTQNYSTLLRDSKKYLETRGNPNDVAFTEQVLKKAGTKKTKAEYETIQHTFKELQDKRLLTEQWLYDNAVKTHINTMVGNALNYGVGKYEQNDIKNDISNLQQSAESKDRHEKLKEGEYLSTPGAISIGQNLPQTPGDMVKYAEEKWNGSKALVAAFNERKAKAVQIPQKDGSIRWQEKGADGKMYDVTDDMRKNILAINMEGDEAIRLKSLNEKAKKDAGFVTTPAMEKEIEARIKRQEILNQSTGGTMGGTGAITPTSAADKTAIRNNVYREYNKEAYDRYEKNIKTANRPVTINYTAVTPTDPKVLTKINYVLGNLSGDALGQLNGQITMRYANGTENQGQQISKDDWNNIKGEIEFVRFVPSGTGTGAVGMQLRAKPGASKKANELVGLNSVLQTNIDILNQVGLAPDIVAGIRANYAEIAAYNVPGKTATNPVTGVKTTLTDKGVEWVSPDGRAGTAADILQANVEATNPQIKR